MGYDCSALVLAQKEPSENRALPCGRSFVDINIAKSSSVLWLDGLSEVIMSLGNKIILIFLMIPLFVSYGWGMCALPEPSEKKIIVESCEVIDPYQMSRLTDFAERYPKGFGNRKKQKRERNE